MKALIEALSKPERSTETLNLPEYDPDKTDADTRSWCATSDLCFADSPMKGGQLIVALSKVLKGTASALLLLVSYPGMTWAEFKKLFTARFVSTETSASILIKLSTDKPKEGETLASYGNRVMSLLFNRWKNLNIEQIVVATTVAHLSQFDSRLQRMAFTSEINNRQRLQQELQAFTYIKRKSSLLTDQKTFETKRMKIFQSSSIKCFHCGKIGHRLSDCIHRQEAKGKPTKTQQVQASRPNQQVATSSSIVCYKCGKQGHISTRCPDGGGSTEAPRTPHSDRRVDVCVVDPPMGTLKHQGQLFTFHYDSGAECSLIQESVSCKFSGKREQNIVTLKGIGQSSVLSSVQISCVVEIDNNLIEILLHVLPDVYLRSDIMIGREIFRRTAPGPDGVPGRVLSIALEQLRGRLRVLFDKCLSTGQFPKPWKTGRLCLLRKEGRPSDSPSAYRPIVLLDETAKMLKKILAARLVQHLEESGPGLSEAQFGFRAGRSTLDALNALRSLSSEAVASGDVLLAISLDVANAFNSIPVETIVEALKFHEVPHYLQRLLEAYLQEREVLWEGGDGRLYRRRT
ncbi:unnamed protein product [Euphydryas editha]|uniref:Reverse transcriptase n=1 Tax=Euphydryas editha TaxID=104508 RepID=A0AAU9TP91_EUPED|nr:unnamed protein product [Euphydryas editha]